LTHLGNKGESSHIHITHLLYYIMMPGTGLGVSTFRRTFAWTNLDQYTMYYVY
jgi:hypothetical protein